MEEPPGILWNMWVTFLIQLENFSKLMGHLLGTGGWEKDIKDKDLRL